LATIVERECKDVCSNQKYENYHEQLEKLTKYYGDCKSQIKPKIDAVANAEKQFKKITAEKNLDNAKYKAMKNKCDRIAYYMNKKQCQAIGVLKGSGSFYEDCWRKAKKVYEADKTRIMVEEANMKLQWRALTRIQCYLLVLNTKNDKDKKKSRRSWTSVLA